MNRSKFFSPKKQNTIIFVLILVAASTLAIKINYFSTCKYSSVAQLKVKNCCFENHSGKMSELKNYFYQFAEAKNPNLHNVIVKGIDNKGFNVAYYQTHSFYRNELYKSSPIVVEYKIKNEKFYKQKFNFEYITEDNFKISYEYDGINRERIGEFGKEIHELDLNLTVIKNQKIYSTKANALLSGKIEFVISSNDAIADNLVRTSLNIVAGPDGTTLVSAKSEIPEKAMLLANTIAESIVESDNSANPLKQIDLQLAKVTDELDKLKNKLSQNNFDQAKKEQAQYPSEYSSENIAEKKNNLKMLSVVLEKLSDSLRSKRNNLNTTTSYGLISDPAITNIIDTLNSSIILRANTGLQDKTAIDEKISNLQNLAAETVRNTRKKVALEQDKLNCLTGPYNSAQPIANSNESNIKALNQKLLLTEKLYSYIGDKKTEVQAGVLLEKDPIIQKAILPHEPSSASESAIWFLFLGVGIVLAIFAVLLFELISKLFLTKNESSYNTNKINWHAFIVETNAKNYDLQFQNLSTKTILQRKTGENQIVTVSSQFGNTGKTYVATNLAKSLASIDLKVLLVDMNLKRQSVEKCFDLNSDGGLGEVFQKQMDINEAIQITSIPNLEILSCGNLPFGINSLIVNNRVAKIFDELKTQYDFIIIDTANTSDSIDAIPFMKISNSIFYIAEKNSDETSLINHVNKLKSDFQIGNVLFVASSLNNNTKKSRLKSNKHIIFNKGELKKQTTPFLKRVALWFY